MAYSKEKKIKLDEETTDVVCEKMRRFNGNQKRPLREVYGLSQLSQMQKRKKLCGKKWQMSQCGGDIVKKKPKRANCFTDAATIPNAIFGAGNCPRRIIALNAQTL